MTPGMPLLRSAFHIDLGNKEKKKPKQNIAFGVRTGKPGSKRGGVSADPLSL